MKVIKSIYIIPVYIGKTIGKNNVFYINNYTD